MNIQFDRPQQKFLFLLGITVTYIGLIVWLDFLQGSPWRDEVTFWKTSLTFSDRLLPTIEDLRDYKELNTPLPFIVFGALEYLFGGGIFAGRLLNLILSLTMILIVGYPSQRKGKLAILCAVGLLMCPYYLWLSGRLYTEMIACFWVVMGFVGYARDRHFPSSIAFMLAIASRQYMLAFPAALATYEFTVCALEVWRTRRLDLAKQRRWLAPAIAAMSILGWIYLFQGLAPETAIESRAPQVQKTTWAITPGSAINFLAFVGLYITIPEFLLFQPLAKLASFKQHWRRVAGIAAGLLLYCILFPPSLTGRGFITDMVKSMPQDIIKLAFFYGFSLVACVRFFQPSLMTAIVVFNSAIAVKALPWDRYVLPIVIAFWYLKSVRLDAQIISLHSSGDRPSED